MSIGAGRGPAQAEIASPGRRGESTTDAAGRSLAIPQQRHARRDGQPRQDLAAAGETDPGDQVQDPRRDEPGAEQEDTQARLASKQAHSGSPVTRLGPDSL